MRDQTITCQRCRCEFFRREIRRDGLMVDLVCAACGWPVRGMELTIETHRWFVERAKKAAEARWAGKRLTDAERRERERERGKRFSERRAAEAAAAREKWARGWP